jgi:RHS repeat-associated protein
LTPVTPILNDSYKYKFGGEEYQDEFDINTYDFGARNYDPALGRWMNIDPLAANYLSMSPYHYSYNNPIRFIDPDGRKIVDKNGNEVEVEVNEDKDGNKTASYTFAEETKKSVIRKFNRNAGKAINSLINTEKGNELVNGAIESVDNISINLSSESPKDRLAQSKSTLIREDDEGNLLSKDIEVTIFTGSIRGLTDSPDFNDTEQKDLVKKRTQNIKNLWKKNKNSFIQKIAAATGHELYHTVFERAVPPSVSEHQKAYDAEEIILKEFGN